MSSLATFESVWFANGSVLSLHFCCRKIRQARLFAAKLMNAKLTKLMVRIRQRHITLVERLKSHTTTSEALVMSQAKLA